MITKTFVFPIYALVRCKRYLQDFGFRTFQDLQSCGADVLRYQALVPPLLPSKAVRNAVEELGLHPLVLAMLDSFHLGVL